jgi:hypothetical protein
VDGRIAPAPDDGAAGADHARHARISRTEETVMTQPTVDRTGVAAVAAGVLLSASVAAELVWTVQRPDGTVTNTPGFALYLIAWTAGAVALVVTLLGLGSVQGPLPRAGRIGRATALAGAVLLVGFGLFGLVTGLAGGAPAEWSFLLFAVGLLLMLVGAVPLALGLRRVGGLGRWWVTVLVAGAGALVALGAAGDPWHDLGLFVCFGSWAVLGLRLLVRGRDRQDLAPAA